jgi:hypothetical protein
MKITHKWRKKVIEIWLFKKKHLKETPDSKAVLWKKHLITVSEKQDLNNEQRNFLYKLTELLDANFFAEIEKQKGVSEFDFAKSEAGKSYGELMTNISDTFTQEQIGQIFMTIGDTTTITDWSCGGNSTDAVSQKSITPQKAVSCNCTGSFCGSGCRPGTTCMIGVEGPICTPGGNCGCGGWFTCYARCLQNTE